MKVALLLTIFGAFMKEASSAGCNICGEGNMVGAADGVVFGPVGGNNTCAAIQSAADTGAITEEQCSELQGYITACACTVMFICNICGEGKVSSKPAGIVNIPGDASSTTCLAKYEVAQAGGFNETFCPTVQDIVQDPCGCEDDVEKPSQAPSLAPVTKPTPAPNAPTTPASVPPTSPSTADPSAAAGDGGFFVALAAISVFSWMML
jgi:cell division septation protein DedD